MPFGINVAALDADSVTVSFNPIPDFPGYVLVDSTEGDFRTPLFTVPFLAGTSEVTVSGLTEGDEYKVQAREPDSVLRPRTSNVLYITAEVDPSLAPRIVVRAVTDYSVLLELVNAPDHIAVDWMVDVEPGDFSAPPIGGTWDSNHLTRIWLTGLPPRTLLKAQAVLQLAGPVTGATIGPTHFRTRGIITLGAAHGFTPENEGSNPSIVGTFGELVAGIGFVPARYPELVVQQSAGRDGNLGDFGIRTRMANILGDYNQASVPTSASQVVKYADPLLTPDPNGPLWFMLVIRPELVLELPWEDVLQGAYEILGSDGDHWWLYQRDGKLGMGPGASNPFDPDGENTHPIGRGPLHYFGDISSDQDYLILFTFQMEVADTSCRSDAHSARVTTPGIICSWLNGVRRARGHLRGDGDFLNSYNGGCSFGSDRYIPTAPSFINRADTLWLGRHSGDGDRNFDGDANGIPFCGAISEFAWGKGHILTDAEAASMNDPFGVGDIDSFAAAVRALNPIVYDRFTQPKPPERPTVTVGA
jgi:hypothetical protein